MGLDAKNKSVVWPFVTKYGTRLKIDIEMFQRLSGYDLIYAISAKVNELVRFSNETREIVEQIYDEWQDMLQKLPDDIKQAAEDYFNSVDFQEQLSNVIDEAVSSATSGMQEQIDDVKESIDNLEQTVGQNKENADREIEEIKVELGNKLEGSALPPVWAGFCTPDANSDTQTDSRLLYSIDGVNWADTAIQSPYNGTTHTADPACLQLSDGRFIAFCTSVANDHKFKHMVTRDFETWQTVADNPASLAGYDVVWAPSAFYDVNGNLKVLCACQVGSATMEDYYGTSHPDMRIMMLDAAVNGDGTVTWGSAQSVVLENGSENCYIDAHCMFDGVSNRYYLVAKNQNSVDVDLFSSISLGAWTLVEGDLFGIPYTEAPCILDSYDGNVTVLGEHYNETILLTKSLLMKRTNGESGNGQPASFRGSYVNLTHFVPCRITDGNLLKVIWENAMTPPSCPNYGFTESVSIDNSVNGVLSVMRTKGKALGLPAGTTMCATMSSGTVEMPELSQKYGAQIISLDLPSEVGLNTHRRRQPISIPAGTTRTVGYVPYFSQYMTATYLPNTLDQGGGGGGGETVYVNAAPIMMGSGAPSGEANDATAYIDTTVYDLYEYEE